MSQSIICFCFTRPIICNIFQKAKINSFQKIKVKCFSLNRDVLLQVFDYTRVAFIYV